MQSLYFFTKKTVIKEIIMDKKTLKIITQRVLEYSNEENKKGKNKEALDAHIEALAEVFGVSKNEIMKIADQVISAEQNKKSFKEHFSDQFWRYFFAVILLGVILILVFLLGRVKTIEQSTPSTRVVITEKPLNTPSNNTQINTHYLHKAMFSHIFVSTMPIKILMIEYFQVNGDFPNKFNDMGLRQEEMKSEKYIESVRLGTKGKIIIKATEKLGKNIIITLVPKEVMGGLNIEWLCKTNYQQSKLYNCDQIDTKAL
jgi:hypothetical protein